MRRRLLLAVLVAPLMAGCGSSAKKPAEVCATRVDGARMCGQDLVAYCRVTDGARRTLAAQLADDPQALRALVKAAQVCGRVAR